MKILQAKIILVNEDFSKAIADINGKHAYCVFIGEYTRPFNLEYYWKARVLYSKADYDNSQIYFMRQGLEAYKPAPNVIDYVIY